ncbi:MAG TPA: hypothetical protein VMT20_19385 [Terriglobia bacterium]|nr:hypothetical protein [Terriglobia bacterium]
MKTLSFWALDATVAFVLSLVYFHQGFHRKNPLFAVWLCNIVALQLVAAWALAAGPPPWLTYVRAADDVVTYLLAAGVLVTAAAQRQCPVNRSLLWGVGGLVVLNVVSRVLGVHLDHSLQIWLRNIAFFGPAIFLLIALSNIRLDSLLLWVGAVFRSVGNRWVEGPALAAVGIFGVFVSRRR